MPFIPGMYCMHAQRYIHPVAEQGHSLTHPATLSRGRQTKISSMFDGNGDISDEVKSVAEQINCANSSGL